MVYKSRPIPGKLGNFNADATVKTYLSNGAKTMREVKEFLEEKGVKYTTDGVIKLLNRLIRADIVKRKDHGKKASIYYLTDKGIHDTGLLASFFKRHAIQSSLNNMYPLIPGKKEAIKKIVNVIGLFAIYSHLVSLNFTGKPQQIEEKRWLWFKELDTPLHVVIWLDDHLTHFWLEKDRQPIISNKLLTKLNKDAAQRFMKIIHTLYPEETKTFDREYQELQEHVNNYNKLIKRSGKSS